MPRGQYILYEDVAFGRRLHLRLTFIGAGPPQPIGKHLTNLRLALRTSALDVFTMPGVEVGHAETR